jgi:NAD(P)-dependent dehydrogenase (short-subunit alcohol dehydrogenase family)
MTTTSPRTDDALRGQVAIVTGAGRGLGRGGAVGLARRGATVIAVARTSDELERTAAMAPGPGRPGRGRPGGPAEVDALVDRVLAEHGQIDVVINNAGMLPFETFENTTPELWHRVMQVNLHAAYQLAWRLLPGDGRAWPRRHQQRLLRSRRRPFILETATAPRSTRSRG